MGKFMRSRFMTLDFILGPKSIGVYFIKIDEDLKKIGL